MIFQILGKACVYDDGGYGAGIYDMKFKPVKTKLRLHYS
jgi:hypothetical protein